MLSPNHFRMMKQVQPRTAIRDVYELFIRPRPHKWGFMGLAATITALVISGFVSDSRQERPYKRDIVYVQDWRLDRTDEQIIAQQQVDEARKLERLKKLNAEKEKRRQEWQKIDDGLSRWGL
ncbi:hypothetical protein ACPVPU_02855 [Sphingomonas sp. CJ99]